MTSSVLPGPIHHLHLHEVVQDPIGEDCRIPGLELLNYVDGVTPQMIIVVAFVEDVIGPTCLVELLFSWKDWSTQHPGINLAYHQIST